MRTAKKLLASFCAFAVIFSCGCGEENEEAVPVQVIMPTETVSVTETYTSDETSMQEAEISGPDDGEFVTLQTSDEIISETAESTAAGEPENIWQTVSFSAVGDNLIHSSIYKQAAARSADGGYDFAYAYENVAGLINEADVAVINQETLICNDLFEPSTYPFFNSPTALGDYMIDFGFDVFTMANNHTLDKGVSGLEACLDYWDTKDVVVAGAYRNKADKENIRTFESGGVKFSVLSYTESLNGLSLPQGSELIIGDAYDIDGMKSDIEKAKEISDVCIVALHWGVENSDVISDYQRTTAKILADAGADIIIGNHPHVLRDIEMITRDDGTNALCAYSLGNFISAQSVGQNLIGGVLQFNVSVCISDTGDEESPVISDVKLIPIVTHYEGEYQNVRLYKFSDYTPELASSHGVNNMSTFGYDYIKSVLEKNISEEYLVM